MNVTSEVETGIKVLIAKIKVNSTPDEALKYTQAALNLAHVHATQVSAAHLKAQTQLNGSL